MRSLILLAAIPLIACSFHGGDNDSQPGVPASGKGEPCQALLMRRTSCGPRSI